VERKENSPSIRSINKIRVPFFNPSIAENLAVVGVNPV
jgi:hypothetical protein